MRGIAKVIGSHSLDWFVDRVGIAIFLSVISVSAKGQEPNAVAFYKEFAKFLPATKADSITLKVINYGCLGSQIIWNVKLKKADNAISVEFYSPPPRNLDVFIVDNRMKLDTSYLLAAEVLKQNLIGEYTDLNSKRFLMEGSYEISLLRRGVNKRFEFFRRGEGLYYILRFNKTYEEFFGLE